MDKVVVDVTENTTNNEVYTAKAPTKQRGKYCFCLLFISCDDTKVSSTFHPRFQSDNLTDCNFISLNSLSEIILFFADFRFFVCFALP